MKNEIIDFLIEAKKLIYAGGGREILPSRPCSHDLQFEKGKYKYIDTYLGTLRFSGEEAVWEENKPVWSMNYNGRVLCNKFSGDFLKEALKEISDEMPFRGPSKYFRNGYEYKCMTSGNFRWFNGYETIYSGNQKVYEMIFAGGVLE